MKKRILVFTLKNNEGHDWRRAFKPNDCEVRFLEVDAMNNVASGVHSGPGGEQGRLYMVSKTEGYWNPDGIVWRSKINE